MNEMDYRNDSISDSLNEGYVTAEEDTSRYLSVLETTSEIILDDLNMTLQNSKIEECDNLETVEAVGDKESEELSTIDINGQQVVVFTVDGRDELYGLQFVQDEQGNLQKYQFQLRTNEEGQLEPISETVELLPIEDDISTVVQQEDQTEEGIQDYADETLQSEECNIASEIQDQITTQGLETDTLHDDISQQYEESELENLSISENSGEIDTKAGILEHFKNVKQEIFNDELTVESQNEVEDCNEITTFAAENIYSEDANETDTSQLQRVESPEYSVLQNSNHHEPQTGEKIITPYEEIFVEEAPHVHNNENNQQIIGFISHNVEENQSNEPEIYYDENSEETNFDNGDNDSDNDDYHIVEGLHITGDMDENIEDIRPQNATEKDCVDSEVVLKSAYPSNTVKEIEKKDTKTVLYYVIRTPEKENVNSLSIISPTLCKPVRSNPRSLLKSSHMELKNDIEQKPVQLERLNKRFSRSKEAIEERLFMNFINRTTIPVVPVRNHRLPRKQKIKPVKRMDDEEIVVQEVFVSSNGFVETLEDGVLKSKEPLKITETVTLTDSDDEYDPKQGKKKKHRLKKHKQKVEITISDTTDSEDSVVEVLSDADNKQEDSPLTKAGTNMKKSRGRPKKSVGAGADTETKLLDVNKSCAKRGRGRPPKSLKASNLSSQEDSESPAKKSKTDDSEDSPPAKNEVNCPECLKSFASQNSLKTHLQHHNLEKSLQDAQKISISGGQKEHGKNVEVCDTITSCVLKLNSSEEIKNKPAIASCSKIVEVLDKVNPKPKLLTNKLNNKGSMNLRFSTRANTDVSSAAVSSSIIYKHKCSECNNTFKNTFLLSKHVCSKKQTSVKYICSICHKSFTDLSKLNIHKRTHVKENLVKNTNVVKVSPKKGRVSSIPTFKFKSPKRGLHKCSECGKICSSSVILTTHQKTHKHFTCTTCQTSFPSRILLDTHIRENCVKKKSPQNRRLSFKIRKSYVQSPRRASSRHAARSIGRRSSTSSNTSIASSLNTTGAKLKLHLPCDSCTLKFTTHAELFDHKVLKHGLSTPDKKNIISRTMKKNLNQQKETFGGMRASAKLTSIYSKYRSKCDLGSC